MAQQGEALVTRSVALPPRYEKLLELEPSGGSRCQLAIDLGNDPGKATRRLVAVHSAPPAVSEDDELRAQFAERAAAFLPLRHPNLVSTFEAVSERGRCYWVTEFVPGQPLPVLLKQARRGRRALSTRKILGILRDVAHALEHAHGAVDAAGLPRPVVHGNLCAASVRLTYEGVVKVSGDIGCGSPEAVIGPLDGLPARLACRAPECGRGRRGDARSDVYALGAILWEALAGRPRSLGLTPQQALALRLRGGEPHLELVCPDVLPALAAVTRRALSTDPEHRHPSVGALREELEQIAQLDVFKGETVPLLGFMCNHFHEEYAALQALLEERAMLHALFARCPVRGASTAHETGPISSLRASGLRRVPEVGAPAPATAPAAASPVIPDLPLAKPGAPGVERPARGFGRTETSLVVLGVAAALVALGWAGNGTRAAGPFDRAEPAAVVPGVSPQPLESVPAEPASAPSAPPSAPGSVVSVDDAEATAAALPAQPEPSRRQRLRPVRASSRARATRGERRIEAAAGTAPRSLATRHAAILFEPGQTSTDGAGVDLRTLQERAPRAIDTQDPYSP